MPGRFRCAALWGAVLILALALRLPALLAGLPYPGYVDEGFVLNPAVRLFQARSWDPETYVYPSLPLYTVAGAVSLSSSAYNAIHGHPLAHPPPELRSRYYGYAGPVEFLVAGRVLTLCASLGIVALTGLLAGRLGGEGAGLLAALLAALAPALVIRGAIVSVDPWATCFILAALVCAENALRADRPDRYALLAGALAGCAATSKYTAALAGLAVAATLLRVRGGGRRKAWTLGLATLAAVATAVATMPALVLRTQEVWKALAGHAAGYAASAIGSYWDEAVRRAEWDLPFDGPELGPLFLGCAALGWLAALLDRRYTGTAAAWGLYAGALLTLFTSFAAQPFRNLLPLVPLACVLVALLLVRVGEGLAPRWRPWAGAAAALLVLAVFLPSLLPYALERSRTVDSRREAVGWLLRHRHPEDTLLVSSELLVVPGEVARLPGRTVVMPVPRAVSRLARRRDVRFILTGGFPKGSSRLRDALHQGRTRARYRQVAAFGGGAALGRSVNRRRVLIYEKVQKAAPSPPLARISLEKTALGKS